MITPGPWEAKQIQKDATALVPPGRGWGIVAVMPMRGRIDSSVHGMSEDDARLVAAAPDLLEACRAALKFVGMLPGFEAHQCMLKIFQCLDKVEKAPQS